MTDPVIASAASYIQLYSSDNPRASREYQIEVKDAAVIYKDAKADRPQKYRAASYKFADAGGLQEFDLRDRFVAAEAATTSAQADADANAVSIAAESVARQQ